MCNGDANILISVEDRHVQNMLRGTKKVELRRRAVSIEEGGRVWIYSKIPTGQLTAYGIVQQVYEAAPSEIWERYGSVSGISKSEFDQYFDDRENGCAIVFQSVNELENKISLKAIREAIGKFHPPQFFKYLYADSPELKLFNNCFA
jgi:predicted transcriptional regulator